MKERKNQRRDGKVLKESNRFQIQNAKSAVEIGEDGGENVRGTSILHRAGKGNREKTEEERIIYLVGRNLSVNLNLK